MKRVKYLKSLLFVVSLLLLASNSDVNGQISIKDQQKKAKKYFNNEYGRSGGLKGASGTIPDLAVSYCSEDGSVLISPPTLDAGTATIEWKIRDFVGSGSDHPTWGDVEGAGRDAKLRFYPNRVDPALHNSVAIWISIIEKNVAGLVIKGTHDFTTIYTTPAPFTIGSDQAICAGNTVDLVLSGSEVGIKYQLQRDGTDVDIPRDGDGNAITFGGIATAGVYTARAYNSFDNSCAKNMSGSATLTVYNLPSAAATNGGDVCLGNDFTLIGDPDAMTVYQWTNASGAVVGTTQDLTLSSNDYGVGSHTFTLTITDGNTCVNTASTTVEIYANPNVTVSNSGPICIGGDLTISSTATGGKAPYNYAWEHVPSGTTYNTDAFTINNVDETHEGEYRLTLTDDNNCGATVVSTVVVVNNNPTVSLPAGPTNVCEGSALVLNATAAGGSGTYTGYVWRKNGVVIAGQTGATLNINPTVAANDGGAYTVEVTDNNGCVSAESVPSTVVIIPNFKPTITNNGPLCDGGRLELNCTTGPYVSYSWTGPDGFTSNVQNPVIDPVTTDADGIYSLTVVDALGCSGTETTDVTIHPNPTVTASNNGPVCLNGSVTISAAPLNGTAPYSFSWTHNAVPIAETGSSFIINPATVPDAGLYEVTVTDNNTCSSVVKGSTNLEVNNIPTVNLAYNNPVCLNGSLVLTATPSGGSGIFTSYVWTKESVIFAGETGSTLTIANAVLADAGDYGVTVIDNNGCSSAEDVVSVVVNSLPVVSASNNGPVCLDDQIELTGGANGMVSYSWTGPNSYTSSTQSPVVSANATSAMNGTYQLEVFDGTCRATATTDVVVNYVTAIMTHTPANFTVCENTALTFSASGQDGSGDYFFEFFVNGASQGAASATNTLALTITANVLVEVEVTDRITNCTDRTSTSITMVANPVVAITSPNNGDSFCTGEAITFVATADPSFVEYVFYAGPAATPTEIYRGPSNTYTHTSGFLVNTEVAVSAENGSGCQALSSIINIVINARPTPVITGNAIVCEDASVVYSADAVGLGKGNYTWLVSGGTVTGDLDEETVSIVWDGNTPHSVSLNYVNAGGCSALNPTIQNITVNPLPVPTISGNTTACRGTAVTYTTETGMNNYAWNAVGGTVDSQNDALGTAVITWNTIGAQSVNVTYEDANSCGASSPTVYAVNVIGLPVPTITGDNTVCTEHTYRYRTETGASNYNWQIVDGAGIITPTANPYEVDVKWSSVLGTEKITVNYDLGGCTALSPTELPVTVNAVPVVAFAGELTVCNGATETYTANTLGLGKGKYTWVILGGTPTGDLDEESVEVVWNGSTPYSVSLNYVNANNCEALNPTIETITVNTVTAGLSADKTIICSNEDITFTATGGITYEFYVDGISVQGPDPSNSYLASGLTDGQVVTVKALDAIACENTHAGIAITVNTVPNPSITGTPSSDVCNGDAVTYNTEPGYLNYNWTVDGGTVTSPTGLNTVDVEWDVVGVGSISISYESVSGACVGPTYTLPITVHDLPSATGFVASPSNNVIRGTDITFAASGGDEYEFEKVVGSVVTLLQARSAVNSLLVSTEAPSANPVLNHGDIVRVTIYNAAGCNIFHEITVGVYDGITGFDVIASSAGHCFGESISSIHLNGFQAGITYELFQIGTPDTSLGKILASGGITTVQWENVVGASPAATFKVVAYYDGLPPTPPVDMNNTVSVEEYTDLALFNMSPTTAIDGAGTCGTTSDITLDGSEVGINYLLLNGATTVATLPGTNAPLNFGAPTGVGTYSIRAVHAITSCEKLMTGDWLVQGDPAIDVSFTIQGTKDGKYCDDGSDAVNLTLSGSQVGYNYELYFENASITPTTVILPGTGAALDFGNYTTEGEYSVILNHGGCTYYMNGNIVVEKVAMPTAYNLVAEDNGHYCQNDIDGVNLSISVSEAAISYQLYRDGNPVGPAITGGNTSFGNHIDEGNYTVVASTSSPSLCTVTSNAINVLIDPLPILLQFDGDDNFCEGGGTALLYIDGPETGVTYELMFDDGTGYVATGDFGAVNGARLEWTVSVEGDYKVQGIKNNADTNCGPVDMNGVKTITEIPLPLDKVVVVIPPADPASCAGTVIKVLAPEAAMSYSVVSNVTNGILPGYTKIGTDVNLDGDIEFDPITDNGGSYRVEAYNNGMCPTILHNTGSGDVNEIIIANANAVAKKEVLEPNAICEGDGAVDIIVRNSDIGTNYNLYRLVSGGSDVLSGTLPGDGTDIVFINILNEGTYKVVGYKDAVYDPTNDCNSDMLNEVNVVFNPLPVAYRLTGSGIICVNESDPTIIDTKAIIGLNGSELSYEYMLLYADPVTGDKSIVDTKTGDGNAINFDTDGGVEIEGEYTVFARSPFNCTSSMEGEIVTVKQPGVSDQLSSETIYTYCAADAGSDIIITGQEFGVLYEVRDESGVPLTPAVSVVSDSNIGTLTIGNVPSGVYTIFGSFVSGGCEKQLNAGNSITVRSEPEKPILAEFNPMFCHSEEGATLGLSSSEVGIDYYVVEKGSGARIGWLTGTGNAEEFTEKVTEGTYYVIAKSFATGCESQSDDIVIVRYSEIELFNMTIVNDSETIIVEHGEIGVGAVNVDQIGLTNSTNGVTYTLIKDNFTFVPPIEKGGTGSALKFDDSPSEGGLYTIIAEENGCTRQMAGTVRMEVKPLIANDTLIAVGKGINEVTVIVHENDELESTVLDLLGTNISFSIVDPSVNPNPDPRAPDFAPITSFETYVGNKVTIDPNTGALLLVKKPSYYGRDSVVYLIYNTEHKHRFDIATVRYFIGNADVDEENNLLIPNAFSPNGDDINDRFVISGSYGEGEESVSESKLEVFNRWGTVIYRSKGDKYGKDDDWWDGSSNAGAMVSIGEKLPSGTYFYVYSITINDEDSGTIAKEFTGFIELRR